MTHDREMLVDDPVLPAAAHLTGPGAHAVLSAAVEATGCALSSMRVNHVQYRPGIDVVVRYRAEVRSHAGLVSDTLLAASTHTGAPAGTLPVEAATPDGQRMQVGVWRWPFDPVLPALEAVVTPRLARDLLSDLEVVQPDLEVVAYRPTERAVVRVDPGDGRPPFYVKVVAPATTDGLVLRHRRLREAGIPVPRLVASGPGWVAMEAMTGPTLRDRLKALSYPWPEPERYAELLERFAGVDPTGIDPVRSKIDDAPAHASMLAAVLPGERERLARIADALTTGDDSRDRPSSVIHGDLHEAQIVVDDADVVGLLDVDDVGVGDPFDDVVNLVGHLTYRASTALGGARHLSDYADEIWTALARDRDSRELDRALAGTLVGLATGPFRIQQPGWEHATSEQIDRIEHLLAPIGATPAPTVMSARRTAEGRHESGHEERLRSASSLPHLATSR